MINLSKFLPFFIPNVYRACSFFTNLDLSCIDNARVIYRKIRYFTSVLVLSVFHAKILYAFLFSPTHATRSAHLILHFGKAYFRTPNLILLSEFHWALCINQLLERYAICKTARRIVTEKCNFNSFH